MPPPMMGILTGSGVPHGGQLVIRDPQQHQQELLRFNNSGFEVGLVSGAGFTQMSGAAAAVVSSSLAFGCFDNLHQMHPKRQSIILIPICLSFRNSSEFFLVLYIMTSVQITRENPRVHFAPFIFNVIKKGRT
ncbi:LOB domain-containing protein 36-like [Quillaja saponaria]|uniref:LOB domain-containing protein 36-like n=1 Tax=Quillaja saponaria TaxID=32244 RepID=A0AAD7L7A7_QUISA|nr:LOB domain-containing protein 36-like [Quillaja saponaria]